MTSPTSTLVQRWEAVMAANYRTPPLALVRGQGAEVWDEAGTAYLDLIGGIATNVLGHAHPAVVEAVSRQISTLGHTSNLVANGWARPSRCTRLHRRPAGRTRASTIPARSQATNSTPSAAPATTS